MVSKSLLPTFFVAIFILSVCFIAGCKPASKKQTDNNADTVFHRIFSKIQPLKLPATFRLNCLQETYNYQWQRDSGYIHGLDEVNKQLDSTFLKRHLSVYDNFPESYNLLRATKLNDSIYVIISELEYDWGGHYANSKIIINTYNLRHSPKPVDRLVLYTYLEYYHQIESFIDTNWVIKTNHQVSDRGEIKLGNPSKPHIYINSQHYQLNPDGKFQIIAWMAGYGIGRLNAEGHFYLLDTTNIELSEVGKRIPQPNGKDRIEYERYLWHQQNVTDAHINWKGDIISRQKRKEQWKNE